MATAALVLTAAVVIAAQGPPAGAGPPGVRDPKAETNEQTDREALLRRGEMGAAMSQLSQQRLAAAIEQTKQDFKRIQLIRNDMVDNLVARKPLDFKLIAKQAGEIGERANRLKLFLMPTANAGAKDDEAKKPEEKPAVEYDDEAMKGALVKLCNTIFSFTGNPMFQDPKSVDPQKATKAGGDLLNIIELSDNIKRNAERLARSPK
ncbi:MAG TPA: hypothetical protein VFA21_10440 [Pyrinomonadaceae bacterium]|nr:hypothetical protein [Pyrinomonadaceae bacterium]